MAVYSVFTDTDIEDTLHVLKYVNTVKSIQNAVGNFHQQVLGNVEGWLDSGATGGVFDIQSKGPVAAAGNRIVFMEVKMRWNTITGSVEKNKHDEFLYAVKSNWGNQYPTVGYLAQIVPKKQTTYDQPWKVSGREANEILRVIDGTTAYHLVTGRSNALEELMEVLPSALNEVISRKRTDQVGQSNNFDVRRLKECVKLAYSASSAFAKTL